MPWSDPILKQWLRHAVRTVVMFLVLTAIGVGLDLLHHILMPLPLSEWLLEGLNYLARFAFQADALTFCYNVALGVWHFFKAYHPRELPPPGEPPTTDDR